ncbi:G-protein coupled receptor 35 [Spinachia spinachia]
MYTFNMTSVCDTTNATEPDCQGDTPQALAYSAVFLLGFLANAAALRAFIDKRACWTDTHIYLLNLVVADSSLILFLPFRIYDAFYCLERTYLCTVLIFIHFTNMYASILTTTAISVQRYLIIRFPLQARTWKKKKETACAVCFLFWAFLLIACVMFREDNYPDNLWTCYKRCKNRRLQGDFFFLMVCLGYITPLFIIVFCSSSIIRILLKVNDESEKMKPIIAIITTNMIVFIICYTPIHVAFVVNYYNPPKFVHTTPDHKYLLVAEWIASTNCCFDSISYFFLLKYFFL